MIGLAKTALRSSRRVRERLTPHRILFHHIPKCGGSAITRPFRMRSALSFHKVDEDGTLNMVDPGGEAGHFARHETAFALKRDLCRYFATTGTALVQAHVPYFPAREGEPLDSYDRITLLREPRARFLSHYFWDKGRDNQNGITLELEEFLDTEQAHAFGSLMTRFLSDHAWPKACTPEAVDAAVQNAARFRIIGFLEDLPKFAEDVRAGYGWKMRFPVGNKGSVSDYDSILTGPLAARLDEVCAADNALYERLFTAGR